MNNSSTRSAIAILKLYQSIILPGFILIVVIWLTTRYLLPNIDKIQALIEEQKGQEQKLTQLTGKLSTLSGANKDEELDTLKKIVAVIPEEKDAFSIFDGLDTIEKDSGVVVLNSDFRVGIVSTESAQVLVRQKAKYPSIDINFDLIGSSDQVISFLKELDEFRTRLFGTKEIAITVNSDKTMTGTFVLSAYYLPFPETLGNPDSPLPQVSARQQEIKTKIAEVSVPKGPEDNDAIIGKPNLFQ